LPYKEGNESISFHLPPFLLPVREAQHCSFFLFWSIGVYSNMRKTQSYNSGDTKVDLTEDSNIEVDSSIDDTIPLMNQQGPVVHQQEPFAWLGDMKRKYLGYREVDIPPWLEDNDFYKLGDWKAFKKPRNNGGEEWVSTPLLLCFFWVFVYQVFLAVYLFLFLDVFAMMASNKQCEQS
jgi:hypothetical protein